MKSVILIPEENKKIATERNYNNENEIIINSFSSLEADAVLGVQEIRMRSLGYLENVKKTWVDL